MKIFISYSQEIKDWINELIINLKTKIKNNNLNVEIIWDKTHLKFGQNMHFFMEKYIREADKVFIFCDTSYTQKANERSKGVGVETTIITPKLYGKVEQTKFIPVILWGCSVPDFLDGVYGIPIENKTVTENVVNVFYSAIQEILNDEQESGMSSNETKKENTELKIDVPEEKIKSLIENYMQKHTATDENIDALFPELNNNLKKDGNKLKTNIGIPKVEISFKTRK